MHTWECYRKTRLGLVVGTHCYVWGGSQRKDFFNSRTGRPSPLAVVEPSRVVLLKKAFTAETSLLFATFTLMTKPP